MIKKYILYFILILIAFQAKSEILTVEKGKGVMVLKFHALELIMTDKLSYFNDKSWDDYQTDIKYDISGWKVINVTGKEPDWSFRREIGIAPHEKEVELTIQATQKAYTRVKNNILEYVLKIPLKSLDGAKYEAITGRSSVAKEVSGKVNSKLANAGLPTAECRWLSFKTAQGNVVFDFNPEGVISYSDWGPNLIRGQWDVIAKDGFIRLVLRQYVGKAGTALNSKLVIFEGTKESFRKRHSQRRYHYYNDFEALKKFCFGTSHCGKGFIAVNKRRFDCDNQAGWLENSSISLGRIFKSGALFGFAESKKPNSFKCLLKDPALYLFTLSVNAGDKPVGRFDIAVAEKVITAKQLVPANTLRTYTWAQWVDRGIFELKFSGEWRISSLAVQMLQQSSEDYKVRRSFWRIAGLYEPSPLYKSIYYKGEPEYKVSIADIAVPAKALKDASHAVDNMENKVLLPDQKKEDFSWRHRSTLGSLGTMVNGNFNEFNTPALIKKRVAELKARKISAITIDGLHSRLLFADQHNNIEKQMKMLVDECHRSGIKVIDHYSLTLLWNWGNGMRFLVEHPGWLQRSLKNNLPNRGICPNNPEFRKFYFNYIKDFIRKTDIDGMMVDEIGFQNRYSCGCEHCRAMFKRDTGLSLPLDECSPLVYKLNSNIFKSFFSWRAKSIGDFYVAMRKEINKVKPEFTLLNYTTHRLFYQRETFVNNGISITEAARACDWLGIEIMTRNPMASFRTVFAFGKLINSMREAYNSPIYRLVYTRNYDIAYFSWALNSMLGQVTWFISPVPKSRGKSFTSFSGVMDNFRARPKATVAVLFSTQSRDWGIYYLSAAKDTNGFIENLNDRNIPSIAVIEPSLTLEKLKDIPVLILPSASCISNGQISTVKQYAENGGTLVLTASSALCDEAGNLRKQWPFNDVFGFFPLRSRKPFYADKFITSDGKTADVPKDMKFLPLNMTSALKGRTILKIENNSKQLPVGFVVNYGKGRIIYISGQFGTANYERYEQRSGYPFNYQADPKLAQIFDSILRIALEEHEFFDLKIDSGKVISTVYESLEDDRKSTLIHLLNVSGIKYKKGQMINNEPPAPAFPELGTITLCLKADNVKEVFLRSPDSLAKITLEYRKAENGRIKIIIPPGVFKAYGIVTILQDISK